MGYAVCPMYFDEFKHQLPDIDPAETEDWLASLDQVVAEEGESRARFIIYKLLKRARQLQVGLAAADPDPLHQHDQPRAGAQLPGQRGARASHPPADPLERGRDGPAGQQQVHRDRRPPRHVRFRGHAL